MATGEQHTPLKSGKKISSSSSQARNDSDTQWLLIPNNLELSSNAKPSKKQRNKEKHRHFHKENLSSSSEVADSLPCKARSSFHGFPLVKSNTATWLKDQYVNDEKSRQGAYDSEEVFSDSDFPQLHQQNVHFPSNQAFIDTEHQEHQTPPSWCSVENENTKSVKDELKKKEAAMVCEILSHIQDFISEAESSWQKLDLSDEPVIKDAFVKLKNAVKDVEGGRENKVMLHHMAAENGYANGVSPSSSMSRVSNSKEIVHRDSTGNTIICNDEDEQDKCNHLFEAKISDRKAESQSSDDCAMADFGERVAAVECERRKLKNKLVELEEEKKIKDELLRELYYLKDAANTVSASQVAQLKKTKEKKKKLGKLQSPSQNAKLTKGLPTQDLVSDIPVSQSGSRHSRTSASVKRDNVRKEQNASFPARRHYEAEGRANEDADIPTVPAPVVLPAVDNPEIKEKIRKLKVAQEHVKVIKDIVVSILETRKSRALAPADQLRLLTPRQKVDPYFSDDSDADSVEEELSSAMHLSNAEPPATNVKEICYDGLKQSSLDIDSHKPEETEISAENLENSVIKKEDLTKLQSQFHQLMQVFPSSDRINDDPVRSSGEGAYSQKKNPSKNVVPESVQKMHVLRTVPHQDNLQLTRQNIVSMESQNQNTNSNLHNRDCNSVKKDNINNLSGKMGKLSIQNSMNSSYPDVLTASNNNVDCMSTFSYELNQNHSLPNEVERKTILDILKRDKKKQKHYDQNQDCHVCCNSSIDSEPLEGSNSALAIDTTNAAWGGSSTQENFEDENEEQAESLEEQDDEESFSVFDKGLLGGHRSTTQYSGQFSNMQHYIESVANMPDKRQRNFQPPVFNRNQNQSTIQSRYRQHPSQKMKSRQPVSSNTTHGMQRDEPENPTCINDSGDSCPQHFPPKFIQQLRNQVDQFQQLRNQVDQLNALCQNQIFNDRAQTTINSHSSSGYSHLPNINAPLQPAPEIPLPYNQQLLLCLSQCYHALYMQQLEIHHLQRCIWHNIEGENSHQPYNLNTRNNQEDPCFRPYPLPSWSNPFNPSSHIFPEQISPMSSAGYFHLPMKPYPNHGGSYATSSATQPARAVIHPTSQNNASSQETLNNQVPPRTRANNFWDNFRSYSRQNLLSTSNNAKRNENAASLVTPQVRQVYPLVTNGSPNRSTDISNTYCNASSFSEYDRPAPNVEDTVAKNSKCNASAAVATSSSVTGQRRDATTNINPTSRNTRTNKCPRMNLESSIVQPTVNPSNVIQAPPPDSPKGSFASIPQSALPHSLPEASGVNPTSEISNMLSTEHKSDFLIGLFHEAQGLKSVALRQKALKMIRELAMSERPDNDEITQTKVQNDAAHSHCELQLQRSTVPVSNQRNSKLSVETVVEYTDNEKAGSQVPSDNTPGNIQNLPTAAIPPLSKHGTPKTVSTGAVRKKPKILSACFSEPISNGLASSHDSNGSPVDSTEPPPVVPQNNIEDVPAFITEKVMSDLISMLPSLKRRLLRDGCPQTFWSVINDCLVDSLRTHLFFCNINLSRKSLVHLRQTVYLFLSLFSGMTLSDIDTDFVKYVEQFIFVNMTCFISTGQFAQVPSSLDQDTSSMELEGKMQELSIKMPVRTREGLGEPTEPVETIVPDGAAVVETMESIESFKVSARKPEESVDQVVMKMLPEESMNFSLQCGPVPQQNVYGFDNYIAERNGQSEHASPEPEPEPVEDLRCDCNPEAEIEPEVEIGTEADLAEADQSPGQQGAIGDPGTAPENLPLDHEAVLIHRNASAILIMNGDSVDERDIENSSECASGIQLCSDTCLDQEAVLDDIPTKLCASEEELPQQLKDEQPVPDLHSDDAIHRDSDSESNGDAGSANLR